MDYKHTFLVILVYAQFAALGIAIAKYLLLKRKVKRLEAGSQVILIDDPQHPHNNLNIAYVSNAGYDYEPDFQYYNTVVGDMTYTQFLERLLNDREFYNGWCRKGMVQSTIEKRLGK